MSNQASFDPYDDQVFRQGAQAFADHGRQCPVDHYQGRFDFFIASDFHDVKEGILQDNETWLYSKGTAPKPLAEELANTGIMTDPPFHNDIRMVIMRGFSPKELKRIAVHVERISDQLIGQMKAMPARQGNFYELFSMPLAARLMCVMIGAPEEDYMKYKTWGRSVHV